MKILKSLLIALSLLVFVDQATIPVQAETVTVRTTLTTAVTTVPGTITITVGSTTGMSASTSSQQNFVLWDAELSQVVAVPSSTTLTVRRGGVIAQHAAGIDVRYGPSGGNWNPNSGNTTGAFIGASSTPPSGSCTRANNQFLPVFQVQQGVVTGYECPNSVTTTTGTWIQWQQYPSASTIMPRTVLAFSGTAVSKLYTALPAEYYLAVTSVISGTAQTQIQITLPCSSVPPGKVWVVGDEGGGAGTSSSTISIIGAVDTQTITAGFTAKAYRSNGTNCHRLY